VQIEACATRGHRIDLKVGQGRVRRVGEVLQWQAGPAGAAGASARR
jgi:tRNA(Ile)-lysidine synthase